MVVPFLFVRNAAAQKRGCLYRGIFMPKKSIKGGESYDVHFPISVSYASSP